MSTDPASVEEAIAAGVGAPPTSQGKRPSLPNNFFKFPTIARLKAVQQFISSFEYRQTPQTSFNTHKFRPLARIMDTAKMMIYSPQPIKCVEAVFLALYLTAGMQEVDRIPLSFKTEEDLKVHQHIVLVVRYGGKYGAFGISRRPELMNKEFEFNSISEVVENYKKAYEDYMHTVLKIRIGLLVEHNIESYNFVCWRYLTIVPYSTPWNECCQEMERHIQQAKKSWEKWLLDGQGRGAKPAISKPDWNAKKEEESGKGKSQTSFLKGPRRPHSRTTNNYFRASKVEAAVSIGKGEGEDISLAESRSFSQSQSQDSGHRECKRLKRRRHFALAAVASKKVGNNHRKVAALKGRTIEFASSTEDLVVTVRNQFSASLIKSSKAAKVGTRVGFSDLPSVHYYDNDDEG